MGILDRVSLVLRANINALLDEAENPELVLDRLIQRRTRQGVCRDRGKSGRNRLCSPGHLPQDIYRGIRPAVYGGVRARLALAFFIDLGGFGSTGYVNRARLPS